MLVREEPVGASSVTFRGTEREPRESARSPRSSAVARIALIVLLGAHLLLSLSIFPPRILFGGHPIAYADYALHFSRAITGSDMLSQYGRQWGYNPFFLAGYPAGTVFDVNNHFVEVAVFTMRSLGLAAPAAFNLLVFAGFFLTPVLIWLAARNFGLDPWAQAVAVALSIFLVFADSQINLTWRIGVIASGMAMYGLPFSLSCLYRYLRERTTFWFLSFVITGSLYSLVHTLSFLLFYGVVALYFLWRFREMDRRLFGGLALFAAAALLVNSFWIPGFLRHVPLMTESGQHWIGDLRALGYDLIGFRDSGYRLIIYLLGLAGLWTWWRDGRKEGVRLIGFVVILLTLLGYVGGELRALRELETYRLNFLVAFLLIVPASAFAVNAVSYLRTLPVRQRIVYASVILLLVLNLAGRNLEWLVPYARGESQSYVRMPLLQDDEAVIQWLRVHASQDRRVLTEHWPLGALLPWYTGMQVIGGPYPLIWMQHNFVNYADMKGALEGDPVQLFGRDIRRFSPDQVKPYFATYNIGWVVAHTDQSKAFFAGAAWLRPAAQIGPYQLYENTEPSSFFLAGTGRVQAETGDLRIHEASEGELILKYHWTSTLVSEPPQELRPYKVLDDPVPFIRLPNNHYAEFLIRDASRGF